MRHRTLPAAPRRIAEDMTEAFLVDKADRSGRVFDGARAIAAGSRHPEAIRADGSLLPWDDGSGPRRSPVP